MSDHGDTPSPRSSSGPASSMSPPPAPASATETTSSPKKRGSIAAEGKVTKRRAARACVSCRARKVRCDVVEGAPCGNCRWDDVECVVQESRRRNRENGLADLWHPCRSFSRKNLPYNCGPASVGVRAGTAEALRTKSIGSAPHLLTANLAKPAFTSNGSFSLPLNGVNGVNGVNGEQAAASLLYQQPPGAFGTPGTAAAALTGFPPVTPGIPPSPALLHPLLRTALEQQANEWPAFIKPIPDRILSEDRQYLVQKQVLMLPPLRLQNALLAAYVEYVHPYMPLMELHDFLNMVNDRSGAAGKVSLFLYHAVMFSATAFVDEALLRDAGYDSRRDARRAFFSRTRLLYDFDYETDRLILVQGLLLMTYWYETPDDQKDTWHWMGVAISLAHTIGLHRDPAKTPMIPRKQKLWKRVWWSCLMRDRLVALGMRRPTRIKSEDFDVPPLNEDDFEIEALPEENQLLGPECALMRDLEMQRELAVMCIEKAKLCMLIGDMLKVQYSVLSRSGMRPEHTTNSTHMLLPNKNPENMEEVETVDQRLQAWFNSLPAPCLHRALDAATITDGNKALAVQRNLLHMIYHTTISALHRPLFLPASPTEGPSTPVEVQETARQRVREAAEHITRMAADLRVHSLERYLPTTGVTVILPAMIVHMLDTKSLDPETRAGAVQGLKECLVVMSNLRNIYAAADFATGFLDALLRKGMLGQQQPAAPTPAPPAPSVSVSAVRPGKVLNRVLAPALNLTPQGGHGIVMPERPSTPPPEQHGGSGNVNVFLNLRTVTNPNHNHSHSHNTTNLFPSAQHTTQSFMPNADDDTDLSALTAAVGATTPPHTDSEDVDMDVEMAMAADEILAVEYTAAAAAAAAASAALGSGGDGAVMVGGGTAGGIGGGGNNFDFDQWLQFPAEGGLSSSDDSLMGGMFADHHHQGELGGGEGGIEWMSLPEGISH
ncbi:fungal-specific transcription factor domain-containing protein [Parachaetomium inaequale]|uniref:Fungal-specific transcription factor domain-containing protein n=1 Tax=Parachaetomium inaequale TaxID=2588326 RepID=A0AAN6PGF5_9PEZI|nr:fungal-specific transcription factor domain-containing protein [Parachaetomium inaequale]